jgi:hypothetical protein
VTAAHVVSPLDLAAYWSILLIPFCIGILSGGQTIYAKMGNDFLGVLTNIWGWIYWLSRGIIPTAAYLFWFFAQAAPAHSWQVALVCGLGSEVILRSKLYVTSKTENGESEDVFKGVFDLIEWWQALCLRQAGISRAGDRQKYVKEQFGAFTDFPALTQKLLTNATGFPSFVQTEITQKINALVVQFQAEPARHTAEQQALLHRIYILKIGYAMLDTVGKSGLLTLNA